MISCYFLFVWKGAALVLCTVACSAHRGSGSSAVSGHMDRDGVLHSGIWLLCWGAARVTRLELPQEHTVTFVIVGLCTERSN